jgi:hypothetical protein
LVTSPRGKTYNDDAKTSENRLLRRVLGRKEEVMGWRMPLKVILKDWEDVESFHQTQERNKWRAVVRTVMNTWVT